MLVPTFLNQFLLEFLKKTIFGKILVEQRKVDVLFKKPMPFFRKKNPKNQENVFEIYFFVILNSYLTNVYTQILVLRQKYFR